MKHYCLSLACAAWVAVTAGESLAQDDTRTISVTGEGKVSAPPDMATIYTGVVTQSAEAAAALEANNKAVEKIMEVLKEHDVASKDVQTSQFNVSPEYKRGPRNQQRPEIAGYRVTNQLRVRVRNLPDLGQVLDALVNAGSNQISGISFSIDDLTGVMNQARNRAVADARSRAELYAHAAGAKVGKVISISEQPLQIPRPQIMGRAMAVEAAGSVPVATGEQEVRATISIVFELRDEN